MSLPKIAFIGLGVMGCSMVRRLQQAGYTLYVHTRSRDKAEEALAAGAIWCVSPGEAAAQADLTLTMVGYPEDVEQVYFAPAGILAHGRAGSLLVDMTTSKPSLAKRIAEAASKRGFSSLDAPVTGGDVGAREGKLSIMVGGDEGSFERMCPVFAVLGTRLVLQGGPGMGQMAKLANQLAVFGNTLGVSEALAFAQGTGLNPEKLLESIRAGAAGSWALENLGPRILRGDFAPGFFAKHLLKDIGIALEEAHVHGLQLPGLELAERLYREIVARGWGEKGTQVLFQLVSQKEIRRA